MLRRPCNSMIAVVFTVYTRWFHQPLGLLLFQGWQLIKMSDRCSGMNRVTMERARRATLCWLLVKKLHAVDLNPKWYLMLTDSSFIQNCKASPSYNSNFFFCLFLSEKWHTYIIIHIFCCWMSSSFSVLLEGEGSLEKNVLNFNHNRMTINEVDNYLSCRIIPSQPRLSPPFISLPSPLIWSHLSFFQVLSGVHNWLGWPHTECRPL